MLTDNSPSTTGASRFVKREWSTWVYLASKQTPHRRLIPAMPRSTRSQPAPSTSSAHCVFGPAWSSAIFVATLLTACAPQVTDSSGNFASRTVDLSVSDIDVLVDPTQPALLSVTVTAQHSLAWMNVVVSIVLTEQQQRLWFDCAMPGEQGYRAPPR